MFTFSFLSPQPGSKHDNARLSRVGVYPAFWAKSEYGDCGKSIEDTDISLQTCTLSLLLQIRATPTITN